MWDLELNSVDEKKEDVRSESRVYTRLTALASWRSEYILRTRLLRSLTRGRPAQLQGPGTSGSSRSASAHSGNAQVTYNSNLLTSVNHLQANFGTGLNKRLPRFIHGADEVGTACTSDPLNSKVDTWGFLDPVSFLQFVDLFPGDAQYGLGIGDIVGVPNTMDVSQVYGMIHGIGFPGGLAYYRSTEEQRGRFLTKYVSGSVPELGIPKLVAEQETTCCVWIAKSSNIPTLTGGLIGLMSGSARGVLTCYSLGTNGLDERRFERGEVTARWVLSPGVPIIALAVDEKYSTQRRVAARIWLTALNALGEIFYLTDLPLRPFVDRAARINNQKVEEIAWKTGRSVDWHFAEPTRRVARPDPFDRSGVDGSYSPRCSSDYLGLSKQQVTAETKEIEQYLDHKPRYFHKVCEGWDMRRRLEVDFAGDDGNDAGESIVVVRCGLGEGSISDIKRFTRCRNRHDSNAFRSSSRFVESPIPTSKAKSTSLFGGIPAVEEERPSWSFAKATGSRRSSSTESLGEQRDADMVEDWRTSIFSFGNSKSVQINVTAIDMSIYALLTDSEDPLLNLSAASEASSPFSSPVGQMRPGSSSDIPGQRARFLAIGTGTGSIILWNMRASVAPSSGLSNTIYPIRIIRTDSPQISCLALSALYLVHGGNDGLVQAWDPLASDTLPMRTLNSRFSSRARRRLFQAEASAQGVGINLFAAGAICLDPDPTVLRGMVTLGTHLRYWSYSSSAADQYKSSKRRLRRSERGSNQAGDRFTGTGRGALKDYIANERLELERDKENRRKEADRLAGRFGVDLLGPGASEDEIMAYATLLSEEAMKSDETRYKSESIISDTVTDVLSSPITSPPHGPKQVSAEADADINPEISQAIRLSLQESGGVHSEEDMASSPPPPLMDIPIKYIKSRRSPSRSPPQATPSGHGHGRDAEIDDLDFALQLSLAEEKSRREFEEVVDFPELKSPSPSSGSGKEKGKKRRS